MRTPFKYITLLLVLFCATIAHAQRDTLTQEVEVTKAYKPTINDANKLNSMPVIEESTFDQPTFNYNIKSQPVFSTFSVNELKAATIQTNQPKEKSYGLVRAGLGSYYMPYGEVFFNNVNSKNSLFGIHAMHHSSFGDIKLEGGNKVDAPYMKNEIEMYIKHAYQNSVLSTNLAFKNHAFNYYGYPLDSVPAVLLEEDQDINYFGTKQAFNQGTFSIGLQNPNATMDDETFGFNFEYHYFGTKTQQKEHFANFTANLQKPFEVGTGILDLGVQYASADQITPMNDSVVGKNTETWFFIKPAWYLGTKSANITIGLNAWFIFITEQDTEAKLTPNIVANWAPAGEIINIFAGIDGEYHSNHYSKIAYENPFVNPDHDIKNSFEKYRLFGGFDGKLSKKTNFKLLAEYAVVDDQNFYHLNESYYWDLDLNTQPQLVTDNTFTVLYDHMKRLKLNAEIFYASSHKLDLLLSFNYYSYQLEEQLHAWNMPDWDANLSIGYKANEQLSFTADFYFMSQRQALLITDINPFIATILPQSPTYNAYELGTVIDLNLKANYQLSSRFSTFAQLNNFAAQDYQKWFGYPVQSLNFMAGVSYSF